jgi:hypothetical protein
MTQVLSQAVQERIRSFPEDSMDAHRVDLVMRDGSLIEDVYVAWASEVIRVGGIDGSCIPVEDVVDAVDRSTRKWRPWPGSRLL